MKYCPICRLRSITSWTVVAILAHLALPAAAQNVANEGPGPAFVPPVWEQYQGTQTSGAVQAIAVSPTDRNVLYLGAVNGGVWASTDGGNRWKSLTDGQASLSVGGLVLNSTNTMDIVAAIGRTSAGASAGGPLIGLLTSTDGGTHWTNLPAAFPAASVAPAGSLPNFDAVLYAGNTIVAASNGGGASGLPGITLGGVYRVDASGAAVWIGADQTIAAAAADPAKPLPIGVPVTGLAVNPTNSNVIYAAVSGASNAALNGIYQSSNNGASFARVLDSTSGIANASIAGSVNMRVVVAGNGNVYAITSMAVGAGSNVDQLLYYNASTAQWSTLNIAPALKTAEQGSLHLTLAVSPTNDNVIYIGSSPPGGDGQDTGAASNLFEGIVDASANQVAWTDLANATGKPHSDFRTIAFDAAGNLLLGSDGGIYRSTPSTGTGAALSWQPIMTDFVGGEIYRAAWNPISHTIGAAFQDNGVSIQNVPGSLSWTQIVGADGTNVVVNAASLKAQGLAVVYATTNQLNFIMRYTLNANNAVVGPIVQLSLLNNGTDIGQQDFMSPFILNATDPNRFAVGGKTNVYLGYDDLTNQGATPAPPYANLAVNIAVTPVTGTSGSVQAMAYGTREATWQYALAVAASNPAGVQLYLSPSAVASPAVQQLSLVDVEGVPLAMPATVGAVVLDPSRAGLVFAIGSTQVGNTTSNTNNVYLVQANGACIAGGTCTTRDLGLTLPATLVSLNSGVAIDNNGVHALFAGGPSRDAAAGNIYTLLDDPTGNWRNTNWTRFGVGMPNVIVTSLTYSYEDDLLAIGTFGRGAWAVPDVTSYFPTARTISLGNGDFNSIRSDNFDDGTTGGRPLVKVGSGTVTLTGDNTYTNPPKGSPIRCRLTA